MGQENTIERPLGQAVRRRPALWLTATICAVAATADQQVAVIGGATAHCKTFCAR